MQKFMLLYSFCFVSFWIWGQFPSTGLRGWTWRRDLSVFFGGEAYAWRGYFRDFTVYFNLMENEWIVASSEKGCKEFIIWLERKLFLTGPTREIPSGAHLARSVSRSECRVRLRGFSHIISSLHDRRFMSQARRTRHFARSARPAQNTPFASLVS